LTVKIKYLIQMSYYLIHSLFGFKRTEYGQGDTP